MNKITILFTLFFAASFAASAQKEPQQVSYALTGVADSFYLDEIVSVVDTITGKTVSVSKTSELFRSKEQVEAKVKYLLSLKEQVKNQEVQVMQEAEEKAKKLIEDAKKLTEDAKEQAKKLREYSPKLSQAADKIQAAITADKNSVFSQKKPDGKTGKKKKNQFTKNN